MVERIFGKLKQFKALDHVRNTMIGHLGIDTKIVCAFLNYTFIPEIYDEPETQNVALRLKKR